MKQVNNPKRSLLYYYGFAMLIIVIFNFIAMPWYSERHVQQINYDSFMTMIDDRQVAEVQLQPSENQIIFTSTEDDTVYKTAMVEDPNLTQRLFDADVAFTGEIIEQASPIASFLSFVFQILLFVAIGQWISRMLLKKAGGNNAMQFNLGKSNARVYVQSTDGLSFKDVAGQDEAKESLTEVVDFLNNPKKYQAVGAKMPSGVLLVGPPGTGKTMLAKAVAGEANVSFFSMSGSEFVEMFAGAGAAKVRDLFKQAKEKAPCIVFIDEIDAIGKKRGQAIGNDEREQTLNQLLTEMDGFEGNNGVMILAASNQPESLDPALLRPGRFDRQVRVELPDLKGREDILKVHASKVQHDDSIDYNKIARMASGASGAELANIVNEAALRAVRQGRNAATQNDFEESIETIMAGEQKKNAILSDKEKWIVSYHEIGHALVAAKQSGSAPVEKITIIPRTSGALGYTMQVSEKGNDYLHSKENLETQLATLAGGRAAEEVAFNSITTGASNDIERMTQLARAMISQYGMSDTFGMVAFEQRNNQYLGNEASATGSAETQAAIDREIVELVGTQYDKAKTILINNRELLDELSHFLYNEETITGQQFMEIVNKYS
ncbi:ATP-dependent zinc metalloprotease FtsH [Aerococcaceae bacterium WS4759]|uniref:ATP-dependent zinc metalloprotease FtsH n=1 Tax=Fundicoccus ignavus TaxID=2664442 RepID=A0A6I2GKM7_9LACT|nr:ATP-dependent zinc metalloprotease FtsH [Fundicoccus ignavus]MRI86081.1 ATP-dependent zinc metalloprotease FtsH [Fundicoccus ignavus]